jgi:hypothetical protein
MYHRAIRTCAKAKSERRINSGEGDGMAIYFILFQASLSTIEDTEAWISSMDLPLVSGTSIATNTNDKTTNPKKMRNKKVAGPVDSCRRRIRFGTDSKRINLQRKHNKRCSIEIRSCGDTSELIVQVTGPIPPARRGQVRWYVCPSYKSVHANPVRYSSIPHTVSTTLCCSERAANP